jgi:hypothetical protein
MAAEDDKSTVSTVGGGGSTVVGSRTLRARKPSPVPPAAIETAGGVPIKKEVRACAVGVQPIDRIEIDRAD